MTTASKTQTATGTRPESRLVAGTSNGQWWKAWVLLASLGTTMVGWMAFTGSGSPAVSAAVSRSPAPTRTAAPQMTPGNAGDTGRQLPASARALPTMPQKPAFQAPVTRTRRS